MCTSASVPEAPGQSAKAAAPLGPSGKPDAVITFDVKGGEAPGKEGGVSAGDEAGEGKNNGGIVQSQR